MYCHELFINLFIFIALSNTPSCLRKSLAYSLNELFLSFVTLYIWIMNKRHERFYGPVGKWGVFVRCIDSSFSKADICYQVIAGRYGKKMIEP